MLILIIMRTVLEGQELDNFNNRRGGKLAISVRIVDGQIEIRKDGIYQTTCGFRYNANIIAASTDGEIIAGLQKDGAIILRNTDGMQIGQINVTGAVGVAVSGGQISILRSDGSTELRTRDGIYINECR